MASILRPRDMHSWAFARPTQSSSKLRACDEPAAAQQRSIESSMVRVMDVHKTYATFQRFSPASMHGRVRQVATAVLTPLRFAIRTGHFRSSLRSGSFTSAGEVIPWYTYPAIDFLARKKFADCSVLEFGSGNSTLWWAKQARSVVALENDRSWYERVAKAMPRNVSLHHVEDYALAGAESCIGEGPFDIIVVDGFDRFKAAQIA